MHEWCGAEICGGVTYQGMLPFEITSSVPPDNFAPALQALWWLKKGRLSLGAEWQKAHAICQTAEGTRSYDLVHALAHWIEGDEVNTAYWYRRVGGGKAATIELEWQRIALELTGATT